MTTNVVPSQQDITQVEKLFQPVEELFRTASQLSQKIEDEGIEREDPDGSALNFLDYEERYAVLKDIWERWKNGANETVGDIDLAGLSGLNDEDDLEYLEEDKASAVDVEFFISRTEDFVYYFEDAIKGLTYCIEKR